MRTLTWERWLTGLWESRVKEKSEKKREKIGGQKKDPMRTFSYHSEIKPEPNKKKCETPPSEEKKLTFKNAKIKTELKSTIGMQKNTNTIYCKAHGMWAKIAHRIVLV